MRRKVTQVARDLASMMEFGLVGVHLDATQKDVDVPPQFKNQKHLLLNLSFRFAHADIELGASKVAATLTFGATPYRCKLPYRAIFILQSAVTGEMAVYAENMPPELLAMAEGAADKAPKSNLRVVSEKSDSSGKSSPKSNVRRPKLQVFDGGLSE